MMLFGAILALLAKFLAEFSLFGRRYYIIIRYMAEYARLTAEDFKINQRFFDNNWNCDGWHTEESKWDNYFKMVMIAAESGVDLAGSSCLDVGCGTGDLSKLLRGVGVREYLGIDIYEPHLVEAHAKYPGENFVLLDLLAGPLDKFEGRFDYVFCSGALTTRSASDNYDFAQAMISKMWEMANAGVAFNTLLTNELNEVMGNSYLFNYDPHKLLGVCRRAAPDAEIICRVEDDHLNPQAHIHLVRKKKEDVPT